MGRLKIKSRSFWFFCPPVFFLLAVYLWRLAGMTPGLSQAEVLARDSSSTLGAIINTPVYLPHKILQYALTNIFNSQYLALRLGSVIFGLIFAAAIYSILRVLFGRFIGAIGSLIFAMTPWVVVSARNSSAEVMLLFFSLILASFSWLVKTKKSAAWLLLCTLASLSIYIPGAFWLLLISLVFGWRYLKLAIANLKRTSVWAGALIFFILLAPLIYASAKMPSILYDIFLIPAKLAGIVVIVKSFAWALLGLVWRTNVHYQLGIGRLPILSILQIAFGLFGLYALRDRAKRGSYFLLSIIAAAALLSAINQNLVFMMLALPAIAILVTAGLRYLYVEWMKVFPKNPIPKTLAISMILLVLGVYLVYTARYSIIAWPHTADTKNAYVLK